MNQIVKQKKINLKFCYLVIAKKVIFDDNYNEIKENLIFKLKKTLA